MTTAFLRPLKDIDDDLFGAPIVVLRLRESFDDVVARNPQLRIEQTASGDIVVMSPAGGEGGAMNSEFNCDLVSWTRVHGGLAFDSSTLFQLPNGAMRSPDASWISAERWKPLSAKEQRGYPPIVPDFVVEIRSPSDRLSDQQSKMDEYMSVGVRLGWLIDPIQRRVHIYRTGREPEVLDQPESVIGEDVLPGFVLPLQRIFPART